MENVRIQKLLSELGVASRRAVEEMIVEGRISVNGQIVNALPCFVDPEEDDITVDGKPVRRRQPKRVYYLLNKPKGAICTEADAQGRPLASQFVPSQQQRLYCVGGLDEDSTGLIIFTNDGKLTRELTSRQSTLEMVYVADIDGCPQEDSLLPLKRGAFLEGKRTAGLEIAITEPDPIRSTVEIKTTETSNKIIRRIFHNMGHKIRRMHRRSIGPLTDHSLKTGRFRPLTSRELKLLSGTKRPPRKSRR